MACLQKSSRGRLSYFGFSSLALGLVLTACSPQLDTQGPCDRCDEGAPATPIAGADTEWYRCWVDEDTEATDDFFRQDYVFCAMTPTGRALDIQFMSVQLTTAEDGVAEVVLTPETPEALVYRANGPAYPLDLATRVHLTNYDEALNYTGLGTDFDGQHRIVRDALPTVDAPLRVTQPFDLLPIEVRAQTRAVSLTFDTYSLALTETLTVNGASSFDIGLRTSSSLREGDQARLYLPAQAGTTSASFSGRGQFYREVLDFEVVAPGSYIADDSGMQLISE